MNGDRCKISVSHGKAGDIAAFIREECLEKPPLFAWAEPDPAAVTAHNKSGLREDFQPLVRDVPSWPSDVPLVEARLFWADAGLHVVKDGMGCRWARIMETGEDGAKEVMRRSFPVYTLRDRRRFGLREAGSGVDKLAAVEYWIEGRLIGWRIMRAENLG